MQFDDNKIVIEVNTPQEMLILSSLIGVIGKDKFIDENVTGEKAKYVYYALDDTMKFKVPNKVAVEFLAFFGQWLAEAATKAMENDENS